MVQEEAAVSKQTLIMLQTAPTFLLIQRRLVKCQHGTITDENRKRSNKKDLSASQHCNTELCLGLFFRR